MDEPKPQVTKVVITFDEPVTPELVNSVFVEACEHFTTTPKVSVKSRKTTTGKPRSKTTTSTGTARVLRKSFKVKYRLSRLRV